MDLPGTLRYLFHELALGFFVWRAIGGRALGPVERVAYWLGAQLVADSVLGMIPAAPWASAGSDLLMLALAWRTGVVEPWLSRRRAWIWMALPLPLLAAFLRPVREADSLFNLHFIFDWIDFGRGPYHFPFHYVSFWEHAYVPSLTLAGADHFLWIPSLKAVALLGSLLWLIAEEFALSDGLRLAAVGNAMLLLHLWHGSSGVSTIKNDMIAAAGQAALGLALLRMSAGRVEFFEKSALIGGAIFASMKFGGPALLVFVVPMALWPLRKEWRAHWRWLAGGAALWIATAGHFYLRNAWLFGNPVYPFQVNIGPLRLPGQGDLSHTSILYSLGEPEVWRLFFMPPGGVSPMGLLFPLTFAALPLVLSWACRRGPRMFALFTLAALFVYLRSIFSASGQPGDLQFVRNDLNSFRYFEGAYLAGELFLVSLVAARGRMALALCLISAASRIWILAVRLGRETAPDAGLVAAGCLLAAGAVWVAWKWPRAIGASLLLLPPAGALMVESRRAAWLPEWKALYGPLYERETGDVFLIADDEYSEQACAQLPLKGRRLARRVRTGPAATIGQERFAVWIKRGRQAEPELPGYRALARAEAGTLYERADR